MTSILTVSGLTVRYGDGRHRVDAVRGVSFRIRPGEIFSIIGESGSGKSTLCRAVMGDAPAGTGGRILFCPAHLQTVDMLATSPAGLRAIRGRRLALLPQGVHALNPLVSVGRHLTETLETHLSFSRKQARETAVALLKRFHLPRAGRVYHAFPHQLSGGMARRVVMAIAFACGPGLLVADEPTRGLDTGTRDQILETLARSAREQGTALLMVTHDLDVAAVSDRIAVLRRGRFVEKGNTGDVLARPGHAYTRALIRARSFSEEGESRRCYWI